jgi:hypothetical protein
MKKSLAILLFLAIFCFLGTGIAHGAGLCESCTSDADCDAGLTCVREKCRGCPIILGVIQICNPIQACDFSELVDSLINFIFWIALALFPLMIVIAGFYFVTAAGDPAKVEKAKGIILYAVIGFIVVILAKGFIELLKQIL